MDSRTHRTLKALSRRGAGLRQRIAELEAANARLAAGLLEAEQAEVRLRGRQKLYSALSRANLAMFEARDEQALYRQTCAIASEFGEFVLAWIALENPDGPELQVAAAAGSPRAYLEGLAVSADPGSPFGRGPTGTAMNLGRPVVLNDFINDPGAGPWRARAIEWGVEAVASFPIRRGGRVTGALSLHADRVGFFDPERQTLLAEIAQCLSFALDALDREAALRRISVVVEQNPAMVVITDAQGAIQYVNPRFTELTGYSAAEVLGRNPSLWKSGELPASAYAGLWAAILGGQIWRGEFHNRTKDGELMWTSATIAPIRDEAGAIAAFVSLQEDITGQRLAGQRNAQLESANAELDAFSYSVCHDLRAPLRTIEGFSQLLAEECAGQLSGDGWQYLMRVRAGSRRMGELIDGLLQLSRVSRAVLVPQELDLSAMAGELLRELGRNEPARRVEVRVEPGLTAAGDRGLIRSVLENLLGNAWKYTAKVAQARIEVLRTGLPCGRSAFCVRDNGAGFDMAFAGKLFTAFQRLHSAAEFEGTGIGLDTVRRIILRHGGEVWAEAAPGLGASFYFTLPEPS